MKKFLTNAFILIPSLAILVTPNIVAAQQGFLTCDGFFLGPGGDCNFCDLVQMVDIIVGWLIGVLFVIFAVVMVAAGFRLVTSGGDVGALDRAKDMFTNAIVGIIIVFAAWLIIDTIMRTLVNGGDLSVFGPDFGPWNTITCETQINPSDRWVLYDANYETTNVDNGTAGGNSNPTGTSVNADLNNLVSLRDAGVVVADWNGINGPGRTDRAAPEVVAAAVSMQESAISQYGHPIFQITAATTDGVGHSPNSQHYQGTAIDLDPINGASTQQVEELARAAGCTFILNHGSHVHCDFR